MFSKVQPRALSSVEILKYDEAITPIQLERRRSDALTAQANIFLIQAEINNFEKFLKGTVLFLVECR